MQTTVMGVRNWRELEKLRLQAVEGEIKVIRITVEAEGKGDKA